MDHRRSALFVVLVVALCVVMGRSADAATDPLRENQTGLAEIKAPEAWALGKGAGVRIAIVSTGIADHPDLVGKVDGGFDATGTDPRRDTEGRGTHLAGIAGAATDNGVGIAGVAPDARLLPFKAFGGNSDEDGDLIRALTETRTARAGVVLVDVPAGYASKDRLRGALKTLGDGGASVVVGTQSGLQLDDLPVLAVASAGGGGGGARGVAAPGSGILSTSVDSRGLLTDNPTYGYDELSGTGQAAAHVAGAVAILRGLGANAGQAADLLRSTARRSVSQGAGVIDVAAAAAAYQTPAPPAPTTSTTKAAVKPAPANQVKTPGSTTSPGQVVPLTPGPLLANGDPAEPGGDEEAVVPPGAEEFADGPEEDGGGGGSTLIGGRERPWGTLTIGFGLLFGVGSGLSLTFRRLADAPI